MAYTSVAKIANIRCKLHKVLPAVYDESLSYLEQLAKLTFKVNETIEATNALNDNVDALNDSVTDVNNRLEAVEGEIEGFESEINKRIAELELSLKQQINVAITDMNNKVDEKLGEVDGKINDLDKRVTEMEQYVRTTLERLISEFQLLIQTEIDKINELYHSFEAEMRQYVENVVAELIAEIPDLTTIYVVDPTSGKLEKVETALNHIFEYDAVFALTVNEFNAMGLTCNELTTLMSNFIPRGLSCIDWMHKAKRILENQIDISVVKNWVDPNIVGKHFITGADCWVKDNVIVNMNQWAWSGSFTSDELVTLGFTCDDIIAFNISCEEYVLRANEIMVSA